jgi:hypothetical protein
VPIDVATGLDPKQKKIAVGVAVAGGAGYLWYRRRAAAAAAAAAATSGTSATDTAATAMPTSTGPGVYGAQGSAASSTTVGSVSTNQDWYAAALTGAQDAGYDAGTAGTALSAYLDHQALTPTQQTIVRIGLAAAGNPPSGTFTIITAAPTSGPGLPAPSPGGAPATPTGLRVANVGTTTADFAWNVVPGAYKYELFIGGQMVYAGPGNTGGDHALRKGTRYGPVTVRAVSSQSQASGPSSPLYITTKSK